MMAWPTQVLALDCTPADITLSSQADVDAFQTNHGPGCSRVTGTLTLSGTDIANLNGLSGLTSVFWVKIQNNPLLTDIGGLSSVVSSSGPLEIRNNAILANLNGLSGVTNLQGALLLYDNPSLSNLSGLSGLFRINASLVISNNDALASLDDLSALTQVNASINVVGNALLQSISGLSGITDFTSTIFLTDNPSLASLDGLQGATRLSGLVLENNDALVNIDELAGLSTIGNAYASLSIANNAGMTQINGLSALVGVNASVQINDNPMLADCSALFALLDGTDDADPGPGPGAAGIADVNGDVVLGNNLTGCNDVAEILGAGPPAAFNLIPTQAGLGTDIGIQSVAGGDQTCGWQPGEIVEIRWDNPDVSLMALVADGSGCFAGMTKLDDSEQLAGSLAGDHQVSAIGSQSGTRVILFRQVEPQLHLSPPSGAPRSELLVTGCNWGRGEEVEVSLLNPPMVLDYLFTDDNGCLNSVLTAPDGKNGFYALQAIPPFTTPTGAAYWIQSATAELTPAEGPPDSRVPLVGCNWFASEVIEFAFAYNNVVFDTAGSDAGGCITTGGATDPSLYIPEWAQLGARTVRATGATSRQRLTLPFNVVERSLVFEPSFGANNDPILMSGCGWVGNATVRVEWGFPDTNNQPIIWIAPVDPASGCFGMDLPVEISVPANSISGPLTQIATGDVRGQTTTEFIVSHDGSFDFAMPTGDVGEPASVLIQNAVVGESISFYQALTSGAFLGAVGATSPDLSFDITLPLRASVGFEFIVASGSKGFRDRKQIEIVDRSEIEVLTAGSIPSGSVIQVLGRNWAATERVVFRLRQGPNSWVSGSHRVPAGTTEFTTGVVLPSGIAAGDYLLEAEGELGRLAQTLISLVPGPASAFALSAAYADPPPDLDGKLMPDEWDYAQSVDLDNGFISVRSDDSRLYILIDLLADSVADTPNADTFWLSFDLLTPGQIDAGWDLNYRLDGGGQLILEEYSGPGSFAPRNSSLLRSAYAAGFGCFGADGSFDIDFSGVLPLSTCERHRVFEIGIDLNEIFAEPGDLVRFGLRTESLNPAFAGEYPMGFSSDFSALASVLLAPSALEPTPPAGALTGIGVNGFQVEVTQAIQDVDNSLDLVAGKDTVARVYPQVAAESVIRTYLFGRRNGADLPGSPLVALATIPSTVDRNRLADTVNFLLPDRWTAQGITDLTAVAEHRVDPGAQAHGEPAQFFERKTPTFWVIPINTGSETVPDLPADADIVLQESLVATLFPVPAVSWVRRDWQDIGPDAPTDADGDPDLKKINDELDALRIELLVGYAAAFNATGIEPFTFPDQIYGFTSSGGGQSDRLINSGNGYVASGFFGTSGNLTMAHEINHNIDRAGMSTWGRHTTDGDDSSSDPDYGCGASGGNADWPRTSDEIGETGFDTRRPWTPSDTSDVTVVPDNWPDYMSYCRSKAEPNAVDPGCDMVPSSQRFRCGQMPFKWVSEYRWARQFLSFFPVPPPAARVKGLTQPVYYVSFELHLDGSGSLGPVRQLDGTPSTDIIPGDYAIEIQDTNGVTLLNFPFQASFEPDEEKPVETLYFHFIIPADPAGARVLLSHSGMVLDVIEASLNPPMIALDLPAGGEIWDGVGDVEWSSGDLDGDDLTFYLHYSPDGGQRWFPLANGLTGNRHEVDAWRLPAGEDGRIMLVATDGFHTVTVQSETAFSVPASAPTVIIERPTAGHLFEPGDPIEFAGRASLPDASDQGLTYAWFVNGSFVESGRETEVRLQDGTHQIRLVAWDAEGNLGESFVDVRVNLNDAPNTPSQPVPADGAVNVMVDAVLDWVGGDIDGDPVRYDVFLEAGNASPSNPVCVDAPLSECVPLIDLQISTSYYWRVVATDDKAASTQGGVWRFDTGAQLPEAIHADGFEGN